MSRAAFAEAARVLANAVRDLGGPDELRVLAALGWSDTCQAYAPGADGPELRAALKAAAFARLADTPKPKRKSGPSGPTKSYAERQAQGQARLEVWLDTGTLAALAAFCAARGLSRAEALRLAVAQLVGPAPAPQ